MLRVGLTGGYGTGKTFVGESLAALGCHLIYADQVGHQVLAPDGEAYARVIEEFGPSILRPDGAIDRRKLASLVFDVPERLERLNRLVHPAVIHRIEELSRHLQTRDPDGIAVVEAAILIESGAHRHFDRMILAVCEPEQQIERAMRRDGLTRQEVLSRLQHQMPLEEKRKYAHYVIDTSGSKEETLRQVRMTHAALRSIRL
jgi:dephospho-CoA kinase